MKIGVPSEVKNNEFRVGLTPNSCRAIIGVVHYCVTNMPGAVPLTATEALNKATLPYILELANKGITRALDENNHLKNGLNTLNGQAVHPGVQEALNKH